MTEDKDTVPVKGKDGRRIELVDESSSDLSIGLGGHPVAEMKGRLQEGHYQPKRGGKAHDSPTEASPPPSEPPPKPADAARVAQPPPPPPSPPADESDS